MSTPTKIFISYSHEDEDWKDFIRKQFEATTVFEMWDDRDIPLGERWLDEIENALVSCNIAILLISSDFLISKFIQNKEMPTFLRRCKEKSLKIVPIIISSCPWEQHSWLESIQGYPKDNEPLATFQQNHSIHFSKCELIRKEAIKLVNKLLVTYENETTIENHLPEKEKLITKLTKYLNDESINLQVLKEISKKYIDQIYHKNIIKSSTTKALITYLEGLVIDDNHCPITCIINHIYKDTNSTNIEIRSWLDNNYHDDLCKSNISIENQQNTDESRENRIILDFEKSENSNKVDLSIRYFEDGKFISNEGKIFIEEDITSEQFQRKVLDKLSDDLFMYKHIDIILPTQFLLTDIKQWGYYDDEIDSKVCLTNDCCVNIHMRERAFRSQIKELWKPVLEQLSNPLSESMKDMISSKDEVKKETHEVGLKYRFLPDNTKNFSHRVMRKMITLRCGDSERLEEFYQWLDDNNDLPLGELKEEVDKSENSHMTIMWNDPNIPLKGDGIDAK